MNKSEWRPDYKQEMKNRLERLVLIRQDQSFVKGMVAYYSTRPIEFIEHFCITYDPRKASQRLLTKMPFILFDRQKELIHFLTDCMDDNESGLIEKSRDMGATWVCTAFSIWLWRFVDGSSVGWGSRKEMLVDRLGDPDSIFEKIRMQLYMLPKEILPKKFDISKHCGYMKIINPENGNTITGEAGDNIGRGGRKSIYFKDESAHYDRAEKIEAALGDTTDVKIDLSSVNISDNVFHRRRKAGQEWYKGHKIGKGITRVFIFDWRDHPNKTQDWYNNRRAIAEREGLLHLFAREVDRDYNSAVTNMVIQKAWINAAIDAHLILGLDKTGQHMSALDVSDGGTDKNALAIRKGIVLKYIDQWTEIDVGDATRTAIRKIMQHGCKNMQYDSIGIGSGVKAETNRMIKESIIDRGYDIVPWNAGAAVIHPNNRLIQGDRNTPRNCDFFSNLSAQAAWDLRLRFERTYKAVIKGESYPEDQLISIDSKIDHLNELIDELSQPTFKHDTRGKILLEKKPDGARSPNMADAVKMCYFPVTKAKVLI